MLGCARMRCVRAWWMRGRSVCVVACFLVCAHLCLAGAGGLGKGWCGVGAKRKERSLPEQQALN